jgi:hypothetical protein
MTVLAHEIRLQPAAETIVEQGHVQFWTINLWKLRQGKAGFLFFKLNSKLQPTQLFVTWKPILIVKLDFCVWEKLLARVGRKIDSETTSRATFSQSHARQSAHYLFARSSKDSGRAPKTTKRFCVRITEDLIDVCAPSRVRCFLRAPLNARSPCSLCALGS